MTPRTRAIFRVAVSVAPRGSRVRLQEQWASELAEAPLYAMSEFGYALGLLAAATRLRAADRRGRVQLIAVVGSVAVLGAAGSVVSLQATRSTCGTPGRVLGVVAGTDHAGSGGNLPRRAQAAIRAIRDAGGYEGVWVDSVGRVQVGVWGPAWSQAKAAASAVWTEPGPTVTYVCEPATQRQLTATQNALSRSPLWQQKIIGFSDIDTRHATVTVTIAESAPRDTEATLQRTYGPLLTISRSRHAFVNLAPGTGRMPLANDLTR